MPKRICYDHKGHAFSTVAEMCDYWHINKNTYKKRKRDGWEIEDILTVPVRRLSSPNDYIGETKITPSGLLAKIVDYIPGRGNIHAKVVVEFEDKTHITVDIGTWKRNQFAKDKEDRKERRVGQRKVNETRKLCAKQLHEGEKSVNSLGLSMTLLEYNSQKDCKILFDEDETVVEHIGYNHFCVGSVANPNCKRLKHESINELCLLYYLHSFGFAKKKAHKAPLIGYELDLYHPALKVAIEYDGVRYHSGEENELRDNRRVEKCESEGVELYRIRESGLTCRNAKDYTIDITAYNYFSRTFSQTFEQLFIDLRHYPKLQNLPKVDLVSDKENIQKFILKNYVTRYEGMSLTMRNGQKASLTNVIGRKGDVVFEDGAIACNQWVCTFLKGGIKNPSYKPRIHERNKNNNGEWMEVIEYFDSQNVTVKFDSGEIVRYRTWAAFKAGAINKISRNTKKQVERKEKEHVTQH